MNKTVYILIKDVVRFHQELQQSSRMKAGIHSYLLLESAINTPFQTFEGEDLYPTVYDKAAQLCYGLTKNHAFTDGNKRTAFHSMQVYLRLEKVYLQYTIDEAENLKIWLIDHTVN